MTDRELLERAAKAAGIKVPALMKDGRPSPWFYIDDNGIHEDISGGGDGTKWRRWNPLNDDGDALRLAVRLRMDIVHFESSVRADVSGNDCHESNGADHCAATRRAIVRAAAEMAP